MIARAKRAGKLLLDRSYPLARTFHYLHGGYHSLRLAASDLSPRTPLLIYQMGKVGSSSIASSLEAESRLDMRVYHVHYLTHDKLREVAQQRSFPPRAIAAKHYWTSRHLRRKLDRGQTGPRWKVITLTREPVARNISAFFQTVRWLVPSFEERLRADDIGIEELIATFFDRYPHDRVLDWFDREPRSVLDIDVYREPFVTERGYGIYRGPFADLLVLKLERLDAVATTALEEFFGIQDVKLHQTNVADRKGYAEPYRAFVDRITLPPSYLDAMYTSRYARTFYSETEIAAFRQRWQQAPSS